MNMRLCLPNTLWKRNGSSEAAKQNASRESVWSKRFRKNVPMSNDTTTHSPDDSPLTPSTMLKALMMPTPAKTVSGMPIHHEKLLMPKSPCRESTHMPVP